MSNHYYDNDPNLICRPFDVFCKICQRPHLPGCQHGRLYEDICPKLERSLHERGLNRLPPLEQSTHADIYAK